MSKNGKKLAFGALVLVFVAGVIGFVELGRRRVLRELAEREAGAPPPAPATGLPAVPEAREPAEAAAAPAAPSPKGGWTIRGRLLRLREGAVGPAVGATVRIYPQAHRAPVAPGFAPRAVASAAGGSFEVARVPRRAPLVLEADDAASGLFALRFEIRDAEREGEKDLGDIFLDPACAELAIRLSGPGGEPVEQAEVRVGKDRHDAGPWSAKDFSSGSRLAEGRGQGLYVLRRPSAGQYEVNVVAAGFAPALIKVEVPQEEPVALSLESGARIAGKVLSVEGKPLAGAQVEVLGGFLPWPVRLSTDPAGAFEFTGLGAGRRFLQANAEGYAPARVGDLEPDAGEVEMRLSPEAVFAGRAVEGEDARPVEGAQATLWPAVPRTERGQAETDGAGAFRFGKLAAGTYRLTVQHEGFVPLLLEGVELAAGEPREGQVLKLERGLTATVKVADASSGEPISGASVSLRPVGRERSPERPKTGRSGEDGAAAVRGLVTGKYTVFAAARGYLPFSGTEVEVGPEALELTARLEKGGAISGHTFDPGGKPLPGAAVEVEVLGRQLRPYGERLAYSDAEGRFALEALPPQPEYRLRATHEAFGPGEWVTRGVEAGASTEGVDLRLSPAATIRGRVLDPEGRGVARARVVTKLLEDQEAEKNAGMIRATATEMAETDSRGAYLSRRLRPGVYTVKAEVENFETTVREGIELAEGQALELDLELRTGESILGRVVDSAGQPVAGASIRAISDGHQSTATSDEEGRFRLQGVRPPAHAWVEKEGFAKDSFSLAPGKEETTVTLRRLGKIAGTVRAKGTEEFPDFRVAIVEGTGRAWGGGRTERTGRFEIEVAEGTVQIEAAVPGFAPARSGQLVVRAGETLEGVAIELVAGGTVEGMVVRKGSGEPVEGAQVEVQEAASHENRGFARSEKDGGFKIAGLGEGLSDVVVNKPGHPPVFLSGLTVKAGEVLPLKIELEEGIVLKGRVLPRLLAVPRDGINAMREDGPGHGEGSIDAAGNYSLDLAGPGRYQVSFMVGGEQTQLELVVPEGPRERRQDLTIPQGEVRGVVVNAGAQQAGGRTRVRAVATGLAAEGRARWTDAGPDGRFAFKWLSPGTYRLQATSPGRSEGRLDGIEVAEGRAAAARIVLQDGLELKVRALGESGSPLPFVFPLLLDEEGAQVLLADPPPAGKDGTILLGHARPGRYRLSLFSPGFAVAHLAIQVQTGAVEETVTLKRGSAVRILVTDGRGAPVEGARVEVLDQAKASMVEESRLPYVALGMGGPGLSTDAAGRASLDPVLGPGAYHAYATKGLLRSGEESFSVHEGEAVEVRLVLRE